MTHAPRTPDATDEAGRRLETAQSIIALNNPGVGEPIRSITEKAVAELVLPLVGDRDKATRVAQRAVRDAGDRSAQSWLADLIETMRREWQLEAEIKTARTEVKLKENGEVTVWQNPTEGTLTLSVYEGNTLTEGNAHVELPADAAAELALGLLSQPLLREHPELLVPVARHLLGVPGVRDRIHP